jgi:GNAT superfamily N-acetyltransferase
MSPAGYLAERARGGHADELLRLFEETGSGCFCNYWYFQGDKNAWLERCYLKPEENRQALRERLAGEELCGVIARPENTGRICGWLNVSRAPLLTRLYEQRIYKGLPCFAEEAVPRERVYAVACCLVEEEHRGKGVAHLLLRTGIEAARAVGARAIEAFPRAEPLGVRLRPDEVQMGPERLFQDAGFEAVSDFRPYPVLRLTLA